MTTTEALDPGDIFFSFHGPNVAESLLLGSGTWTPHFCQLPTWEPCGTCPLISVSASLFGNLGLVNKQNELCNHL